MHTMVSSSYYCSTYIVFGWQYFLVSRADSDGGVGAFVGGVCVEVGGGSTGYNQ